MRNFQNVSKCQKLDIRQVHSRFLSTKREHAFAGKITSSFDYFLFFHNRHGHFSKIEQVAQKVKMKQKWVIFRELLTKIENITYAGDTLTVILSIEPLTSDLAP